MIDAPNINPSARVLRQFGLLALLVFGVLAALVFYKKHLLGFAINESLHMPLTIGLGVTATLSGLFSLLMPTANRPLFVLLTLISFPIGLVVSTLLLMLVFYGLITPIGMLMRLFGRDAMQRDQDPKIASYWIDRRIENKNIARYLRQY